MKYNISFLPKQFAGTSISLRGKLLILKLLFEFKYLEVISESKEAKNITNDFLDYLAEELQKKSEYNDIQRAIQKLGDYRQAYLTLNNKNNKSIYYYLKIISKIIRRLFQVIFQLFTYSFTIFITIQFLYLLIVRQDILQNDYLQWIIPSYIYPYSQFALVILLGILTAETLVLLFLYIFSQKRVNKLIIAVLIGLSYFLLLNQYNELSGSTVTIDQTLRVPLLTKRVVIENSNIESISINDSNNYADNEIGVNITSYNKASNSILNAEFSQRIEGDTTYIKIAGIEDNGPQYLYEARIYLPNDNFIVSTEAATENIKSATTLSLHNIDLKLNETNLSMLSTLITADKYFESLLQYEPKPLCVTENEEYQSFMFVYEAEGCMNNPRTFIVPTAGDVFTNINQASLHIKAGQVITLERIN